jgi:LmbE family N-acetylglucosaminyl deacetylase
MRAITNKGAVSWPCGAARRPSRQAGESASDYVVLDNHDGELVPSLDIRQQIIRQIREWKADLVLAPRPNDYHPDHRYTGVLLQDAASWSPCPTSSPKCRAEEEPGVPVLRGRLSEAARRFVPTSPSRLTMSSTRKSMRSTRTSRRSTSGLPGTDGDARSSAEGPAARKAWLKKARMRPPSAQVREALVKWYGADAAAKVQVAEAFEICEYGTRPDEALLRKLFPFFPTK